jgi:hypothetical protein
MDISFMLSGKKSIEITGGKCDIENCWNFLWALKLTQKLESTFYFHIHIVLHLDIIKVFFIHQLMHKWIVLKTILKFTLK